MQTGMTINADVDIDNFVDACSDDLDEFAYMLNAVANYFDRFDKEEQADLCERIRSDKNADTVSQFGTALVEGLKI